MNFSISLTSLTPQHLYKLENQKEEKEEIRMKSRPSYCVGGQATTSTTTLSDVSIRKEKEIPFWCISVHNIACDVTLTSPYSIHSIHTANRFSLDRCVSPVAFVWLLPYIILLNFNCLMTPKVFPIFATNFRPGILYDDITVREDQPRVVHPERNLHILLFCVVTAYSFARRLAICESRAASH